MVVVMFGFVVIVFRYVVGVVVVVFEIRSEDR